MTDEIRIIITALWRAGGDGQNCEVCGEVGYMGSRRLYTQTGAKEPEPTDLVLCQSCADCAKIEIE